MAELILLSEHVRNQANRVTPIVFKYWFNAQNEDLSPHIVGGCDVNCGYNSDGIILLERKEDVEGISKEMSKLVAKCRCKGLCSARQCSCVKRSLKCLGCDCDRLKCENNTKFLPIVNSHATESSNAEDSEEDAPLLHTSDIAHISECIEPVLLTVTESLPAFDDPDSDINEMLNMVWN